MRLAIIDFLKRGEDADVSSVLSARRIAAPANKPNSVTKSAPSSPVADQTTSNHSPSALRANGPSRRAAARSTGFVNLGHFCFAGTLADISTIGPRSSTRPALTTSETDDATSSGAQAEGVPGDETEPPAGQSRISTLLSDEFRYSIRSKTSDSTTVLVDDEVVGCIIDASIADAALSHCFFASTIPFSSIPRKTTNNVDGRFFDDAVVSTPHTSKVFVARNASNRSIAGPR